MIGVLETTGAYSVKLSARAATVIPVATTPTARATAVGIQAVLTRIALPPSKTWGLRSDEGVHVRDRSARSSSKLTDRAARTEVLMEDCDVGNALRGEFPNQYAAVKPPSTYRMWPVT